jgi:hypothetical protein
VAETKNVINHLLNRIANLELQNATLSVELDEAREALAAAVPEPDTGEQGEGEPG